ncbi:MAG: hypothetical protein H3C59_11475 [Burkholderiaceae bacterium]|nr:hypothetical protein [Burkholderiaceae bacterium]
MRRLLLVLVLANVLMFGWNRGWFDGAGDLPSREENADRLRPVPLSRLEPPASPEPSASPEQPASLPPPARAGAERNAVAPPAAPARPAAPPGASSPGSSSAASSAPPAVLPAAPTAPAAPSPAPVAPPDPSTASAASPASAGVVAPVACRAFPPLDEDRAPALRGALEQSGATVNERRIEQGASYLVYLPPADSAAQAQQRLAELRRIGRDDAFVIQDGPMRLAISLGLFRFESAARAMVDQLARAGETRAQVAPRPPIQVRIALQARWPQAEAPAIANMLGAQFDAPARDCD